MKYFVLISGFLFFNNLAQALIDTKSGNYTKTYIDFSVPGLALERTYNSRSLYKGIFGFGWCSNIETRLEVLPDNSLNVVECGGGMEVPYVSRKAGHLNRKAIIQSVMAKVRKQKGISEGYIQKVKSDLHKSPLLQSELIRALGLQGKASMGTTYYSVSRPDETIYFTGRMYKRTLSNGRFQFFDKKGLFVKEINNFGDWMKITRDKDSKVQRILTSKGLSLRFQKIKDKKKEGFIIVGANINMIYIIKNDNLLFVTNNKKETHEHLYDGYHNMIKTRYPDNTYDALTYNTDKDWVEGFKDRRNCTETYDYITNSRNKNHYWTDVKKRCGRRVTNVSRYEFWNRVKKTGGKYLYRAKQTVNGKVADITYDERSGSPLSITRNRITTKYDYDDKTGVLTSRTEPGRKTIFSDYDKMCHKPQRVVVNYIKGKKVVKTIQTKLSYHPKNCRLSRAAQIETGRWVVVKRDGRGRIKGMYDQSKKQIVVSYNDKTNKLHKITRPGVGSILVAYNKEGLMDPLQQKYDPTVVAQVTNVFNGFLEIVSLVSPEIVI